ncbi:TRAF3-interacting protein 1 isoform 1 [Phytophthora palmivora]|uniref:TRAF3-interacting protein 1 isoform 1 n=1 Tax=Phytophthora palmivora TaxID=4796 RepID=A0A2P4YMH0_9STRA|nr:TRAF3-interacting protein 1 isoform 1 [Phytophthora palmivora]
MGKSTVTKTTKQSVAIDEEPIEDVKAPIDTRRARRAVPRDAAIVLALNTTFQQALHVHDPIDAQEADSIFAFAVKGLADRILLPIFTSNQHVIEDGDLFFECDTKPVAPKSDRHASKLIHKRIKRRKQSYGAVKTTNYGNYPPSRASSRTESRLGGSRIGGSRASISVRGARLASKKYKMSLVLGLNSGGDSILNAPWIDSRQESTETISNNTSWLQDPKFSPKGLSPPSSIAGTARRTVDFVEIQRRADIERDLHTRESDRLASDEINRKNTLRLKLRSLADPTVSLEKEEAIATFLGAKGQNSRTRAKTPAILNTNLSPLSGKRGGANTIPVVEETMTFRTEDYEGLTSDVVFFGRGGELLVGENCFVVEQKLRQELLLDLQTRGVVQPRIQVVATPKQSDDKISDKHSPKQYLRSFSPPSRQRGARSPPKQKLVSSTSEFGDQIGSFDSSPSLALDLQVKPLAKGVVLKSVDSPTHASKTPQMTHKASIMENVPNVKLEKQLSALMRTPGVGNITLASSQSDSILHAQKVPSGDAASAPNTQGSNLIKPPPSAGSPVLPKHIHNGEKHLQNLRIRTPAYPNRLSRKTLSRSSAFVDSDETGWDTEDTDNLYSLEEPAQLKICA